MTSYSGANSTANKGRHVPVVHAVCRATALPAAERLFLTLSRCTWYYIGPPETASQHHLQRPQLPGFGHSSALSHGNGASRNVIRAAVNHEILLPWHPGNDTSMQQHNHRPPHCASSSQSPDRHPFSTTLQHSGGSFNAPSPFRSPGHLMGPFSGQQFLDLYITAVIGSDTLVCGVSILALPAGSCDEARPPPQPPIPAWLLHPPAPLQAAFECLGSVLDWVGSGLPYEVQIYKPRFSRLLSLSWGHSMSTTLSATSHSHWYWVPAPKMSPAAATGYPPGQSRQKGLRRSSLDPTQSAVPTTWGNSAGEAIQGPVSWQEIVARCEHSENFMKFALVCGVSGCPPDPAYIAAAKQRPLLFQLLEPLSKLIEWSMSGLPNAELLSPSLMYSSTTVAPRQPFPLQQQHQGQQLQMCATAPAAINLLSNHTKSKQQQQKQLANPHIASRDLHSQSPPPPANQGLPMAAVLQQHAPPPHVENDTDPSSISICVSRDFQDSSNSINIVSSPSTTCLTASSREHSSTKRMDQNNMSDSPLVPAGIARQSSAPTLARPSRSSSRASSPLASPRGSFELQHPLNTSSLATSSSLPVAIASSAASIGTGSAGQGAASGSGSHSKAGGLRLFAAARSFLQHKLQQAAVAAAAEAPFQSAHKPAPAVLQTHAPQTAQISAIDADTGTVIYMTTGTLSSDISVQNQSEMVLSTTLTSPLDCSQQCEASSTGDQDSQRVPLQKATYQPIMASAASGETYDFCTTWLASISSNGLAMSASQTDVSLLASDLSSTASIVAEGSSSEGTNISPSFSSDALSHATADGFAVVPHCFELALDELPSRPRLGQRAFPLLRSTSSAAAEAAVRRHSVLAELSALSVERSSSSVNTILGMQPIFDGLHELRFTLLPTPPCLQPVDAVQSVQGHLNLLLTAAELKSNVKSFILSPVHNAPPLDAQTDTAVTASYDDAFPPLSLASINPTLVKSMAASTASPTPPPVSVLLLSTACPPPVSILLLHADSVLSTTSPRLPLLQRLVRTSSGWSSRHSTSSLPPKGSCSSTNLLMLSHQDTAAVREGGKGGGEGGEVRQGSGKDPVDSLDLLLLARISQSDPGVSWDGSEKPGRRSSSSREQVLETLRR